MTPVSKSEVAMAMDAEKAANGAEGSQLQRMIGPLNVTQRYEKILKYILRKRMKGSGEVHLRVQETGRGKTTENQGTICH